MRYGVVRGVEKPVSRLVQGTALGFKAGDQDAAYAVLDSAYEYGITTFDTAHVYGPKAGRVFGRWIKDRGLEDKIVVLAKGAHHADEDGRKIERVNPEAIAADLSETLEWMQLDRADLYVLHRDDPAYPVGPIVEALNALKRDGRIGAFGGSNWSHARIAEANAYAAEHGLEPFGVSSPNFSLAEQFEEPWAQCLTISGPQGAEAREWYRQSGMSVFSWSSLAAGFFSGRFRRDNLDALTDYEADLCKRCYCREPNFERLDRAEALAKEKGATIAQIALAFVFNQPIDIYALTFSANAGQFKDNARAVDMELTASELDWLDLKTENRTY